VYCVHLPWVIEIIAEYPTPIGEDSTSGLALQEVVLTLHCRSHRTNGAANSLFRFPVLQPLWHDICEEKSQPSAGDCDDSGKGEDSDDISVILIVSQSLVVWQGLITVWIHLGIPWLLLYHHNCRIIQKTRDGQRKDAEIKVIIDYHENGILPDDDKKAKELHGTIPPGGWYSVLCGCWQDIATYTTYKWS